VLAVREEIKTLRKRERHRFGEVMAQLSLRE
jgi:hypothetical protein